MEIYGGIMKTTLKKNANGYGYKYTDLAEIHNYLDSINSRYIQKIERIDGDDYIFTKKCFDGKWEDEWIQGSRVVQATLSGIHNPAQEQGSALTYARRYSLLMAYGLATDDDDGASLTIVNKVSKEEAEKYILPSGKHMGKLLTEVPDNYLHWLYENNEQCKAMIDVLGIIQSDEEIEESMNIIQHIMELVDETGVDLEGIKAKRKITSLQDLSISDLKELEQKLTKHKETLDKVK